MRGVACTKVRTMWPPLSRRQTCHCAVIQHTQCGIVVCGSERNPGATEPSFHPSPSIFMLLAVVKLTTYSHYGCLHTTWSWSLQVRLNELTVRWVSWQFRPQANLNGGGRVWIVTFRIFVKKDSLSELAVCISPFIMTEPAEKIALEPLRPIFGHV
jgi:hypothetical protein